MSDESKKAPLCRHWNHRGFSRFGDDRLTKKRDSLSTVSLVREAGLEFVAFIILLVFKRVYRALYVYFLYSLSYVITD